MYLHLSSATVEPKSREENASFSCLRWRKTESYLGCVYGSKPFSRDAMIKLRKGERKREKLMEVGVRKRELTAEGRGRGRRSKSKKEVAGGK